MADSLSLPQVWDEPTISRQLVELSKQSPTALITYVDGVKQRFILRQNEKTAIARIDFIKKVIEHAELARKYQGVLNDLAAMKMEQEIRLKKLEVEGLELDHKRTSLNEVEWLKREKEKLQLELEMARLRQEIDNINNLSKPELPASKREPTREERIAAQEAHIRQMEEDRDEELAGILQRGGGSGFEDLPPREQDRYTQADNSWDEKIEAVREELRKLKQQRRPAT